MAKRIQNSGGDPQPSTNKTDAIRFIGFGLTFIAVGIALLTGQWPPGPPPPPPPKC